jgi:aryl-alcohol dehydrogenase-like predicted oxidoreductase/enamine deaminase RidA (YjgF/YER057c/UK114 family)
MGLVLCESSSSRHHSTSLLSPACGPTDMTNAPERLKLSEHLDISRALTGLWQVADIEKDGTTIDPETGADWLSAYAETGFDTFDMADHYGSAEIITGRLLARGGSPRPLAFTKWCPAPGPMTSDVVRAGVEERLQRLGVDRVDLLQFHWWSFEHPQWLDALHELARLREDGLIAELGVTNFDAAHFNLALSDGVPLLTNQVSFSLIDRRAADDLAAVCERHGAWLLAYGTLNGGFLSQKWLGEPEPQDIADWSKMKYHRFIRTAGGWQAYQTVLRAAAQIAQKHDVSVSNVATRWVLEQQRVAGVVIGARLGEAMHTEDNLRLFSFQLDDEDRATLEAAFAATTPIPGDCGDEYRKPPFLTASGDLSHHLDALPSPFEPQPAVGDATRVLTGSYWEDVAGYCRAQRIGDRVLVSGTTAVAGVDRAVAPQDAGAQTTYILDRIIAAVTSLGGAVEDIARTRIYITDEADVEAIARAHGRVFGEDQTRQHAIPGGRIDRRSQGRDRRRGDHRAGLERESKHRVTERLAAHIVAVVPSNCLALWPRQRDRRLSVP